MDMPMFCFQCQETAGCKGCTRSGVCGKTPDVAAMQDLLIYVTKGISQVASAFRAEGKEVTKDTNHLVTTNLFTTITNANFDKEAIIKRIEDTLVAKKRLLAELSSTEGLPEAALWEGARDSFEEKARTVGVLASTDMLAADQASVDMVFAMKPEENHDLVERMTTRHGLRQLSYMKELGIGNDRYALIDLDHDGRRMSVEEAVANLTPFAG